MKEVYFQKQYRFAKLGLSWVWGGGDGNAINIKIL